MAIRQLLRRDLDKPITVQLQESQDLKDKQKADGTNAARENARTGNGHAKIRLKLRTGREEMVKTRDRPLSSDLPKPFKMPEKFYEYPWEVQRTMAIRQQLRARQQ